MSSFASSASRRTPIVTVNDFDLYGIERGSRLEFERSVYAHWAVYIGDGKICHLTEDPRNRQNSASVLSFASSGTLSAVIIVEDFVQALIEGSSSVYVNNSSDSKWTPLPPDDIVRRALSRKGRTQYSLTRFNCEHFVNWCRYGEKESEQVQNAAKSGAVLGTLALEMLLKKS